MFVVKENWFRNSMGNRISIKKQNLIGEFKLTHQPPELLSISDILFQNSDHF